MKKKVHLIMPMGGAGTRFSKDGYELPKPLIRINEKPFFYWATQSISKFVELEDITFVVLQEHIEKFNIDKEIKKYYENANIVILDHVLNGAVLTCIEGVKNLNDDSPIIFNDCDHMFLCDEIYKYCNNGEFNDFDGALVTFESNDPKYSFLQLDETGKVTKTVEKVAISNKAICGIYYFNNKEVFMNNATKYLDECNYTEYFVSGVYNTMINNGLTIKSFNIDYHLDFGTPEEYEKAKSSNKFRELM